MSPTSFQTAPSRAIRKASPRFRNTALTVDISYYNHFCPTCQTLVKKFTSRHCFLLENRIFSVALILLYAAFTVIEPLFSPRCSRLHIPRQYHACDRPGQRRDKRPGQRIAAFLYFCRHKVNGHRIKNRLRAAHHDRRHFPQQ